MSTTSLATGTLIAPLTRVRNGTVSREDTEFWNRRQISFQPNPEQWNMTNPRTLIACCFSKDRARLNEEYMKTFDGVCVVVATRCGTHAQSHGHQKEG